MQSIYCQSSGAVAHEVGITYGLLQFNFARRLPGLGDQFRQARFEFTHVCCFYSLCFDF